MKPGKFPSRDMARPTDFDKTEPDPKKKEIPPEVQQAIEDGNVFIGRYQELFHAIAGDRSLTYQLGKGFKIDLKGGQVTLDVRDFIEQKEGGESEDQVLWSVCHEIGHFKDLMENPEGMLKHFNYMMSRATGLAPKVLEIWKRKLGGELPKHSQAEIPINKDGDTRPFAAVFMFKKLHMLYNSLDDVHVNEELGLRTTAYGKRGSKAGEIKRLYRDYLFPTDPEKKWQEPEELQAADYMGLPNSYQLAYYVLRKRMVPDQEILVSDRVQTILNTYKDRIAEKFGLTFEDEVNRLVGPANSKSMDPEFRYRQIRAIVEPIFLELLFEDLEELDPPKKPEKGDGEGEPGDGDGVPGDPEDGDEKKGDGGEGDGDPEKGEGDDEGESKDGDPEDGDPKDGEPKPSEPGEDDGKDPWEEMGDHHEPFDSDVIKDFIKQQKDKEKEDKQREKEEKELKRLTPEQREAAAQRKADEQICKDFDVDPAFARQYRELQESVQPYIDDLAEVFAELMKTIEERLTLFWSEGFTTGRFNVDRLIKKYGPDIAADNLGSIPWNALDTFDQRDFFSRMVLLPNKFTLRLVGDGSGSMDESRIMALQQLMVLFEESFSALQEMMNLKFRLKETVETDSEVRMFGKPSGSKVIKELGRQSRTYDEEMAARFKALSLINNGYGNSTCDAAPLWQIAKTIDEGRMKDLRDGKALDIVISVTDGGSNSVSNEGSDAVRGVAATKSVEFEGESVGVRERAGQDTRNAIGELAEKGVIVRSLQVGSKESLHITDRAQFQMVWGEDGERVDGPEEVSSAVARMLAEEIQKIKLKLQYYEVNSGGAEEYE